MNTVIISMFMVLTLFTGNIYQAPLQTSVPATHNDLSIHKDLREAQKDIDYEVLVPTYLPAGTECRDFTVSAFDKGVTISYTYDETITRFSQRPKRAGASSVSNYDPNETETTEIDIMFKGEIIKATWNRHTERLRNMVDWEHGGFNYSLHATAEIEEVLKITESLTSINEIQI